MNSSSHTDIDEYIYRARREIGVFHVTTRERELLRDRASLYSKMHVVVPCYRYYQKTVYSAHIMREDHIYKQEERVILKDLKLNI